MRNKGITLIALIVTIIILLVLAGVGITMLMGDNGILNKANIAKKESEFSNEIEQNRLGSYNEMMNSYTTRSGETTLDSLSQQISDIGITGNSSYSVDVPDRIWTDTTFTLPAGKYLVTACAWVQSSTKNENTWFVGLNLAMPGQQAMAQYNATMFQGVTSVSNIMYGDTDFTCTLKLYHNYGSTQSFTVRYNYIKIK